MKKSSVSRTQKFKYFQILCDVLTEPKEVRTVRLVNEHPPGLFTEHTDKFVVDDDDMDSDTVAESDMS